MDETTHDASHINLVGGALCLDFANTVSGRDLETPTDRLGSYKDLVDWAEHVGGLSQTKAAQLHAEAIAHPDAAAAVLGRAVALRESLYQLFAAHTADQPLPGTALSLLNDELAQAMVHAQLRLDADQLVWAWEETSVALDQMLWPVARSAADLLTSGELARVRQCEGEHCGWLFVDRSKNRSRRWCDMKDCGNVAKVRRYRRRKERTASR